MDFLYLFRALMHRKWIIIGVTVLAMTAAFFFTMGGKKNFRATAQLSTGFTKVENQKLNDEKVSTQQIDIRFNNVLENITSPRVRALVGYSLMLHDLNPGGDQPFTTLSEKDKENPNYRAISADTVKRVLQGKVDSSIMLSTADVRERQVARYLELFGYDIETIGKSLDAARYQTSDFVNIAYISGNPDLSAFAANATLNQFTRVYVLNNSNVIGRSVASLDSAVRVKKVVLDSLNTVKTSYMSKTGTIDVGTESSSTMSQIASLESQRIEEQGQLKRFQYQVQQLNLLVNAAREKQPGSDNANRNNSEFIRLRQERADLVNQYKAGGSTDQTLRLQIADIDRRMALIPLNTTTTNQTIAAEGNLDDLLRRKVDAEAEVQASSVKIAAINGRIGALQGNQQGMASTGGDIRTFDRAIEQATTEYTDAKQRLDAARNIGELAPGAFSQTLIAEPPLKAEPSKRLILMLLSGVIAFMLSAGTVITRALMDKSIRTPSNFHRLTSLPLIGVINNVKFKDVNILEQVSYFDDQSSERRNMFKEFLRKLRFELESSGKKIFLFTSTEPNHGKTSLIQALAYSLSLGKKRVLIIDTNFCNNDLTMAIHAKPVLEKFEVNGKPFSREDVARLVTPTSAPGVGIIGCSGGDYTPSEGLPKNHLLNYLHELQPDYDYIFLEGAPLNGFTDTKELTAFADGMIAIFSAEQSLSEADFESIDFLKQNDKFIGAVLNKVQDENISQ